jgi:TonB-dependent starch-binding outer membrane protein SusC
MTSYLVRLHYDYKTKYLLTGTIRRDGSSRFGSNKRWGNFPSASIGWNISRENFFHDPKWLTNLKLRASYGISGNNKIGNYTWIPEMGISNYTFSNKVISGKIVSGIENINLSWEKSRESNVGLDLTLFTGKLNFIFDYYKRITENMLWPVNLPRSSGFGSMMENIGKLRNKGMEFSVNSINITKKNFIWETNFNISFNRNKVLDLGDVDRILQWNSITTAGQPMAMFYTWHKIGIIKNESELEQYATFPDQSLPGTPIYEDKDGNGIIDEHDKMIIGNPWPDFTGGISNSLNYKNWNFNIFMSFAHNFDIWSHQRADFTNYDGVFNVFKEVEQRWKSPEEPGNGSIPNTFGEQHLDRAGGGNSDYVNNVSYLKIQNVNIGYSFKNINFANLKLYCSVQNLHVFTNYPYGNPDASLQGSNSLQKNYDKYDHPLPRTISIGINVQF